MLISSCVQVFAWKGKLEMEGRFWKLMVLCHPSLPRVWDVPLHLPQREQLFVERRKRRKTWGGDQKDSSSNPHLDYLKYKSS